MERDYYCIGELIKEKLAEKGHSVGWLAKNVGYTRSNIYKTLYYEYIHTELLLRISKVLEYDFFSYYSNILQNVKK